MNTPFYNWRVPTDNEGNKALAVRELAADVEATAHGLDTRLSTVEDSANSASDLTVTAQDPTDSNSSKTLRSVLSNLWTAIGNRADRTLSNLSDKAAARTNLQLGNAATKSTGTGSDDVATGNHTHSYNSLTAKPAFNQTAFDGIPSNDALLLHLADSGGGDRYGQTIVSPKNFFVGRTFYRSDVDDFLFLADQRFSVSVKLDGNPDYPPYNEWFNDKSFAGSGHAPGTTRVITIDLTAKGEFDSNGLHTAHGNLYLTFYYLFIPQSVTARVQDKNGTWWDCGASSVLRTTYSGQLWGLAMSSAENIVKIELTMVAQASQQCWLMKLEHHLFAPTGVEEQAGLSRKRPQRLYYPTSWLNPQNQEMAKIDSSTGKITTKGDAIFLDSTKGPVIYCADDGHFYRIKVLSGGVLSTVDLGTVTP